MTFKTEQNQLWLRHGDHLIDLYRVKTITLDLDRIFFSIDTFKDHCWQYRNESLAKSAFEGIIKALGFNDGSDNPV